jgi:hypothetical protein
MKNKSLVHSAAVLGILMICGPVFAHHGTGASYDLSKHIKLKGTVTTFNWSNPHLQVYFDVKDNAGNVEHWVAEIRSSLYQAKRAGWTKDLIKPKDEITITGNPAKSGAPALVMEKLVLPDGTELAGGGGGPAE